MEIHDRGLDCEVHPAGVRSKKVMIIQKELLTLTERPIATNWKATDNTMHGILGRTDLSGGLSSSHYDPWQIMIDENMKIDGAKK